MEGILVHEGQGEDLSKKETFGQNSKKETKTKLSKHQEKADCRYGKLCEQGTKVLLN